MRFKFFAFLLLATSLLRGSEEIRIYLSTTSSLEAVYVGKSFSPDNSFPSDYLKELDKVVLFDLNHNSSMKALPSNYDRDLFLMKEAPGECFNLAVWKNWGANHVIKIVIRNQGLFASVFSTHSASLKQFPEIKLTGTLSKDRRLIHRLADGIYKALYGQEGVASTRILYAVKFKHGDQWLSEIWACDWDGANHHQVTHEKSYCITPVFIPVKERYSNDQFLYVSYKMGKPKICIASLHDGLGKKFIELRGNQLLPAISQRKDKIAFISDASGSADLFLQPFSADRGAVGKPVQLFSYPQSSQASPTFSPDGSKLAFVSNKDGSPRIYTIPAVFHSKRATPQLISRQNRENSCPAWSPDGKKLAYSAKTKGTRQIWIYDFESGQEWQLTDGGGNKENPSWAQDSKHIVFNSTDGNISELYLVNLNQPEVVKITNGPGLKHYPTWGIH